jgi:predicted ATPase
MSDGPQRLFVLTGGPGAGKSTLVDALASAGYARSVEAGRSIIRDQVSIGGPALPWRDPGLYAELQLCWDIRSYRLARERHEPVFFDRGIPDVVGYLELVGLPVPAHMRKAVEVFRYDPLAFVAPPWPEIYGQDKERRQTFDEAERTFEVMTRTYAASGYELVTIPRASIGERVRFILETAGLAR